ncbi:MAG: sigma-70 family RNA polymerase sigma factor [Bacteroidales bacterium]|nr:sigma-70 family RNA polymerase sigma factor [Bacteroidales bacterium]
MKKGLYKDEKKLLEDLKNTNQMAIFYIYKKFYPTILNFIKLNGGDENDAKDIFQESVLSLFYNLQNPNFELKCQLKTYLYSVSKNLWLNELKKKNKITNDLSEVEEIEEEFIELSEKNENLLREKRLLKALEKLGEPCKTIIELFYVERLSMQQIAERMGYTNAENAKNQKYKCLLRLKKIFFQKSLGYDR